MAVRVVAVGCGRNDQAASGAAELVPAGSVMYGEATLKPKGDQKQAIDAILAKFPGGGQAGDKLKDLIEKGMRESDAPVSFKKDIEPWLGAEAAFFVSNLSATGEAQSAAGLIATDDEDKARAALEKSAEGKLTKHDYKDVEYLTDDSKEAVRAMAARERPTFTGVSGPAAVRLDLWSRLRSTKHADWSHRVKRSLGRLPAMRSGRETLAKP